MPKKVRELKSMLRKAGFTFRPEDEAFIRDKAGLPEVDTSEPAPGAPGLPGQQPPQAPPGQAPAPPDQQSVDAQQQEAA